MKTYKVIFSCQSPFYQLPDSQTLFGAICNIIKHTQGEQRLQEYVTSFQKEQPEMVHSSMFLNGYLPMVRKNIFPLDFVNQMVMKAKAEDKLSLLEGIKKYKKIVYMSEELYHAYLEDKTIEELTHDMIYLSDQFKIHNGKLTRVVKDDVVSIDTLRTRNGEPLDHSTNKTLFYSKQVYYPKGTEFCVYVKTNQSSSYLKKIFHYLEYLGVGNRRSVGMNVFHFERVEEVKVKANSTYKLIVSKYIPNEEIEYSQSYYQIDTKIYRGSKDYAENKIIGKYSHIIEGSYMKMKENKEFYGKVIQNNVNGKPIYHYGIGFVL